ncbi:MAG: cation:proton antiporter subunit C [Gemmatimonadota bacterium]
MITLGHFNYVIVIVLMMVGFYVLISQNNLVKKVVGLNIFQTSVIIFYVSAGKIIGGTAPILIGMEEHGAAEELAGAGEAVAEVASQAAESVGEVVYSNPLPHVLMLTAIVVGVATMSMALAIIVRIREAYGTIEDDEITLMDLES